MSAPEPVSALASAWTPGRHGAINGAEPVVISRRQVEIVQIAGREPMRADAASAVRTVADLEWPQAGLASTGTSGTAAIWIDPDSCVLTRPWRSEASLYHEVRQSAHGCAVIDQSHGKCVLRVGGENARAVLAKGCRIDLHPRVFGPGRTAVSPIARINCALHQIDAVPSYDLILPATLVRTFVEWLEMSAAEFGYTLE